MLVADDVGAGAWRGALDAVLVLVYGLAGHVPARVGQIRRWLRATWVLLVDAAGVVALTLTLADAGTLGNMGRWPASAAFGILGAAYIADAWLLRRRAAAYLGLTGLVLAVAAAVVAAGQPSWEGPTLALLTVALTAVGYWAGRLGAAGAMMAEAARWLGHATAALALTVGTAVWLAELVTRQRITWHIAASFGVVALAYSVRQALSGRAEWTLVTAITATLAALLAGPPLGLDPAVRAWQLVALAAAWGLGAELVANGPLRRWLHAGLGVQALLPLVVVTQPAAGETAVLLVAAGVLAVGSWRAHQPLGLLAVGLVASASWEWFGVALFPDTRPLSASSLAVWYSPLPVVASVAAMTVRVTCGRRWALPLYGVGSGLGLLVAMAALDGRDPELAGRALFAYGAAAYVVAVVEGSWQTMAVALGTAALGVICALAGSGATWFWYQIALGTLSVVIYAGQVPWGRRRPEDSPWVQSHRLVGLGGTAAVAASGFILPGSTGPGSTGALVAAVTELVLAAVLFDETRRRDLPVLDYVAVSVAASASFFVAHFFGAVDPQWYVLVPGRRW